MIAVTFLFIHLIKFLLYFFFYFSAKLAAEIMSDPLRPGKRLPNVRHRIKMPKPSLQPPSVPEVVAMQHALIESAQEDRPEQRAPEPAEEAGDPEHRAADGEDEHRAADGEDVDDDDGIMPITDDMQPRPHVHASADSILHDVEGDFHFEGEEVPPSMFMTQAEQEANAELAAKRDKLRRQALRKTDKNIGSMLTNIVECMDILKKTEVSFFYIFFSTSFKKNSQGAFFE